MTITKTTSFFLQLLLNLRLNYLISSAQGQTPPVDPGFLYSMVTQNTLLARDEKKTIRFLQDIFFTSTAILRVDSLQGGRSQMKPQVPSTKGSMGRPIKKDSKVGLHPWYLYKMVVQNMLRTYEVKKVT